MDGVQLPHLKKKNIYDNELRYKRSKTGEEFCFELNEKALEIVKKYDSDSELYNSELLTPTFRSIDPHVENCEFKLKIKKNVECTKCYPLA